MDKAAESPWLAGLLRRLGTRQSRGLSVRACILIVIVACWIPSFTLAALFAHQSAVSKREQLEWNTERITRELAIALDRELATYKSVLETLATSQNLQSGHLGAFETKLHDVAARLGIQFTLRSANGKGVLVNTASSLGDRPQLQNSIIPDEEQEAIRTGKPVVSNLVFGRMRNQHIVLVVIPVMQDGKPAYLLSAGIQADQIRAMFRHVNLGADDRVVVADGNGKVIARLSNHHEWVGRQLSPQLLANMRGGEGTITGPSAEGTPVFGAYRRLTEAPWFVGATAPQAAVDAPWLRALWTLGTFGTLFLGVALFAGNRLGLSLSKAIDNLAQAGAALRRVEPVTATISTFRETNLASEQLAHASRTIVQAETQTRRRLMAAIENERLRIARDLHDEAGQGLSALIMSLKSLEASLEPHAQTGLKALRERLGEVGKSLHRTTWELRPAAIDEMSLDQVVDSYVEGWSSHTGIKTDVCITAGALHGLSTDVRTTVYRVVQESLSNIAKHAAGAKMVSVVAGRTGPALLLTIEDDGPGFDLANSDARGLGHHGMRERLELVGGALEIESEPGRGTTVFVRIPLNTENLCADTKGFPDAVPDVGRPGLDR